jgi:LSD1 subclass zinc finger protein
MSIAVVCSKCAAKLNAPDGAAGKKVKCPKCQTPLVVPEPLPAAGAAFEVVDDAPSARKPTRVKAMVEDDDDDDRPRKKKRRVDDEEEDDRARKRRRKGDEGGVSMMRNIVMGIVLIILIAVAGYIFYERSKEKDEKSTSNIQTNMFITPLL